MYPNLVHDILAHTQEHSHSFMESMCEGRSYRNKADVLIERVHFPLYKTIILTLLVLRRYSGAAESQDLIRSAKSGTW